MAAKDFDNEPADQAAACVEPVSSLSLMEDALLLWHELRGLAHDQALVVALETRQAGETLVDMIAAALMIGLSLTGAWLGCLTALVIALTESGVATYRAILLAVALNLFFALVLCGVIRHKRKYLQFPATLQTLKPTLTHLNTEKP